MYLYVISHKRFPNRVKIGISRDPETRIRELNKYCPDAGLELAAVAEVNGDRKMALRYEKELHTIMREEGLHIHAEWFRLSVDDATDAIALITFPRASSSPFY